MRLGVVADIHGNEHALEAALAFLSTQEVDAYLCAGDLVG
jgi:predicted phosphodiesterase